MSKINIKKPLADDYLRLIRRCPLRVIQTKDEYDSAVAVYAELLGRADSPGLSTGESDYTDVLSRLISEYDDNHHPIPKAAPIDVLKHLMQEHGMKTSDLGKLLGSGRGHASLILNGKRELSKANIRTLADRFKVSAALFLEAHVSMP